SMCTSTCGDGLKAGNEPCDDGDLMGGDGCSATCTTEVGWSCTGTMPSVCVMRTQVCGDGFVDAPEQCDDNNTRSVDGCSSTCRTEFTEIEPNEDGSPSTGGLGITGNDVNATAITNANTNGARLATNGDTAYLAAFSPAGDEDVFAITNDRAQSVTLRLDVWNRAAGFGQGVACGTSIDTGLRVLNSSLTVLASNDDRNSTLDQCSGLQMTMTPGQTVYAHVMEYGDNAAIAAWGLEIRFLVCGDGIVASPAEACDDGNSMNGDGCSSTCTVETGFQCSGQPSVCRPPENQCNDGMDNDMDGQTDCSDTDCAAGCTSYFPACTAGQNLRVFNSGTLNLAIPDGSTTGVSSNINVTATGTITRVATKFSVTHPWISDIAVSLRGPTGAFIDGSSNNGGISSNYTNTILDSTCSTLVTSGVAPFTGCYRPEAAFTGFNGQSMTGTWTFRAADTASLDSGTFNNWSLIMCTQ
ncbi:MAG: DUF4215 domain-containing protein, partial [Archangium sp.]|nr:DUF4215 domain-containing protein [Archangium sp.]